MAYIKGLVTPDEYRVLQEAGYDVFPDDTMLSMGDDIGIAVWLEAGVFDLLDFDEVAAQEGRPTLAQALRGVEE